MVAPDYQLSDFQQTFDVHNLRVKTRDLLRLPLARMKKFQGSFSYRGAKT